MRNRFFAFFLWCVAVLAVFSIPLVRLVRLALDHGYSSHIVLVPIIVVYLVWSAKASIFASSKYSVPAAVPLGIVGIFAAFWGLTFPAAESSSLGNFLTVLSPLLLMLAGFIAVFGVTSARKAAFPFGMLIFMLPVPGLLLEKVIYFLQAQSAELTYWMFTVLHVPVLRGGFVMTVPGASIRVAEECSGINSSVALLILMIIFAHETLTSNWRRLALVLLTIPFSIIKNAIRIVTLTLLATKVDPGFLTGRLHHEGGFVFFLITLVLVYPVWKLLQKSEGSVAKNLPNQVSSTSCAHAGQ